MDFPGDRLPLGRVLRDERQLARCAGFDLERPGHLGDSIAGFLFELGQELELAGGLPFAKLYASPADAGFAIHFDQYHVMVAQLSGSKRWRFSPAPVVDAPIASGKLDASGAPVWCDPHDGMPIARDDGQLIDPPDLDKLEEAVLTEGDFLYLPPGSWHVARALGHSLATKKTKQV